MFYDDHVICDCVIESILSKKKKIHTNFIYIDSKHIDKKILSSNGHRPTQCLKKGVDLLKMLIVLQFLKNIRPASIYGHITRFISEIIYSKLISLCASSCLTQPLKYINGFGCSQFFLLPLFLKFWFNLSQVKYCFNSSTMVQQDLKTI